MTHAVNEYELVVGGTYPELILATRIEDEAWRVCVPQEETMKVHDKPSKKQQLIDTLRKDLLDVAAQANRLNDEKIAAEAQVAALRAALELEKDKPAKTMPRLVVCAIIIRDGRVLLERRAPAGVPGLDNMWDLPGGKV